MGTDKKFQAVLIDKENKEATVYGSYYTLDRAVKDIEALNAMEREHKTKYTWRLDIIRDSQEKPKNNKNIKEKENEQN
jgi:hypothetical protein